jgi:2-oxoglutarate dehydrogenase E1 component
LALGAQFGANAWLVDELYARFLQDRSSVDPAWWDFFEGYQPSSTRDGTLAPSAWDEGDRQADALGHGDGGAPTPVAQPAQRAPRSHYPQPVDLSATPTAQVRPARADYADSGPRVLTEGEDAEDQTVVLRGPAARAAANMV